MAGRCGEIFAPRGESAGRALRCRCPAIAPRHDIGRRKAFAQRARSQSELPAAPSLQGIHLAAIHLNMCTSVFPMNMTPMPVSISAKIVRDDYARPERFGREHESTNELPSRSEKGLRTRF